MTYKSRRFTVDEHFFDVLDTEEKCYVLGFFCADGYVDKYGIRFGLSWKDRSHLRRIADAIGSNAPIHRTANGCGKSGNTHWKAKIHFCSVHLATALRGHDLADNKTQRCIPPLGLTGDLLRHFYRGLFDGDGSIGYYQGRQGYGYWVMQLTGNPRMLAAFASFVGERLDVSMRHPTRQQGNAYRVRYAGMRLAPRLAQLLYERHTMALARKALLAKKVMTALPRRDYFYWPSNAELLRLYEKCGHCWASVARMLDVPPNHLAQHRYRKMQTSADDRINSADDTMPVS